jgi:hypothetical protein
MKTEWNKASNVHAQQKLVTSWMQRRSAQLKKNEKADTTFNDKSFFMQPNTIGNM